MEHDNIQTDLDLSVRQIIEKYGLLQNKARSKSFGQHFLCDFSLLKKIVLVASPFENESIIEIGPGPCGLTRSILSLTKNNKVFCIEKDKNLKEAHDNLKVFFEDRLNFIYEDALKIKLQDITSNEIIIIANLPYNVATPLLLGWLHDLRHIKKMVLMFQKEVADRICAPQNTKEYGRLSVISQVLCKTEKIFNISDQAFFPKPKVTSSVVRLTPKKDFLTNTSDLENITNICFQQRRKTMFSILKKRYEQDFLENALTSCDIEKTDRPENVSPSQFLKLSEFLRK